MNSPKRARHALPAHKARHAKPSPLPGRIAVATAAGGFLIPLAVAAPASATEQSTAAVRVAAPAQPIPPGQAPVTVRLVSDGQYVRNGVVEVQIPEGSGWRTIAKAGTDSEGLGRTSLTVRRDQRIRAYYRGSAYRSTATSTSDLIDVETFGRQVINEAARHNGKPYSYGAVGPSSFDCSGFTRYVFGRFGRSLPHNARAQRDLARPIARADVRVGDLVFMDDNGHVGIYAGNGYMWDAPRSGKTVSLRRIYTTTFAVGRIA